MPGLLYGAVAAESRRLRNAVSLLGARMLAVCHASLWMCSRSSFCSSLHATLGRQAQRLSGDACKAAIPLWHCTDGRQRVMHEALLQRRALTCARL